jgi:adenine-specific DNA-methyltransferase
MPEADTKKIIKSALQSFRGGDLSQKSLKLYQTLGYNTERQNPFSEKTYRFFKESFLDGDTRFSEVKALVSEWKYVDLLFQLSKDEITPYHDLFDTKQVDRTIIETYLFFVIELSQDHYSRTALSQITRELNKVFPMPVMGLFKYGQSLTLAVINRRLHKRDERKDVLEKVTLIKDISIENPHRAHIEILFDLSFSELLRMHKFSNFVELHNAWQKTLDTKELNKRFYQELANWYFWAMEHVSFPDDVEKNKEIRNATSLIRLITRIIFIWFIKEKNLVPEALFDRTELDRLLKEFAKNKKSNSYYNAILQNLFFGSLNQKMNERGFAKDGNLLQNKSEYGVKNLFRYANHFAIGEKDALALFKDIPFLNGGLFDCLDKENEEGKVLYSDGFSRNPKKQTIVPDFLFFGSEEEYDLNVIYGTKNKRYKVKGLIDILSGYKFTVTENTPVEEEVALDPELLGRVFENLLASYNPETQTTARKQTGSFYTPREIVNYMVDESLKAYLKQALADKLNINAEDAEAGLEILFSYTEREHAFTDSERKVLIAAIDACKILDPACGSGAFPMGILHKLVHILHKLDPDNILWRDQQRQKAIKETEETFKLGNKSEREQRLIEINDVFENNSDDYGRKLYLIENCIFGVDIQPIAGQISKLRFFISLVVDQNKQPGKENLGIRSLPNLETKFVAANTLIGLEKPKAQRNLFENKEIITLEEKLKELRHRYFSAKTRKEKMACQKEDKTLRQKIAKLLVHDGWAPESAKQIVAFDPYDQNASSPFFDPEWMFGIKGGFDVVIGNPPYIDSEAMVKVYPNLRELLARLYQTTKGNWDYYIPFYEKAHQLLTDNGIGIYITPNKWLSAPYGKALRQYFSKNFIFLCNCSKIKVFEAGNNPIIFGFGKGDKILNIKTYEYLEDWKIDFISELPIDGLQDNWGILLSSNLDFINKLNLLPERVRFISSVENPFSTSEAYILTDIIDDDRRATGNFKLINTGTIDPFKTLWGIKITSYLKNKFQYPTIKRSIFKEAFPKRYAQQACPKIIISGMRHFESYFDVNGDYIAGKSTLIVKDFNNNFRGIIINAILNSSIISFYLKESFSALGIDGGINFSKEMVEGIPLPKNFENDNLRKISTILSFLNSHNNSNDKITISFNKIMNAIVYELYLPETIQASGCEVVKHLGKLPELKDDWSNEQKLKTIEKVYKELSNPSHPVSIAMEKMKTVPEVRIIEGLDKNQ